MGRKRKQGGGGTGEEASSPLPLFRFILLSSQFQPIKQRRTPRKRLLRRLETRPQKYGSARWRSHKLQCKQKQRPIQ